MTTPGRGRGYTGRHHIRDPRPGDTDLADLDAARTLAELSPRSTESRDREKPEKASEVDPEKDKEQEKSFTNEEDALKELLTVDEEYAPLVTLLEQFSPGEDGIQFNRKLKHFEATVTKMCPDEVSLQNAFGTFRAAALRHPNTARKLAAVGASFTRQQRQQVLRATLLNVVMQGTFSKLDVLERANPIFLINAANLMGDYFAEARLCNGHKVHILAGPLLQYLRALLASDDLRAHRSLATQLMQNGRELLSQHTAQELDDLSISIRLRLLTPPPVSIIWLLLSADLCLNKFLPLPNTLQQFYASHLELTTDENYSEVSYGSWKKSPEKETKSDISIDSLTEKASQNLSQINLNHEDDAKPKLRPILGAGAGLLRQEQALSVGQDNFETWTAKNTLSKRYDLNSWRQTEEEKEEPEVFNPTVLPPNFPTVPDYPPPNLYYPENVGNYLQQGDGTYIQNQYSTPQNFTPQGDAYVHYQSERPPSVPDRINNEIQKNAQRRPVENWRREKSDLKEDPNRNRQRNWNKHQSKDSVNDEEDKEKFKDGEKFPRSASRNSRDSRDARPGNRTARRNSGESEANSTSGTKTPMRRHVTDVPRNNKYWDHDDRCDKDYNS
ncbi:uncharacterized protein LOC113517181 [Galleria mellonella]|uniref:Uncharacterized protein LOC113517181 n=1 Tax=Galleria mellonella TaxID=7137 RepID=A0ABM3N0U1_GALME|nr:uncharacterized protein LOC113517181 [Galleria mellonella]XP_052757059.1 uncharacterized protein LOC113517181 [Galleria mellonella]